MEECSQGLPDLLAGSLEFHLNNTVTELLVWYYNVEGNHNVFSLYVTVTLLKLNSEIVLQIVFFWNWFMCQNELSATTCFERNTTSRKLKDTWNKQSFLAKTCGPPNTHTVKHSYIQFIEYTWVYIYMHMYM